MQQQPLTETEEDDFPKIDCRKRGQEKRSIDEGTNHDAHCTRQKGDVPSNGGRSRWRGSRSFPRSLRPSFVKADEHLRGHPQRHCVRTNSSLACHRSYGCARSSLSIARSVGECLDDMSICGMHAHTCIDRCSAAYTQAQVEAEHSTWTCTGVSHARRNACSCIQPFTLAAAAQGLS